MDVMVERSTVQYVSAMLERAIAVFRSNNLGLRSAFVLCSKLFAILSHSPPLHGFDLAHLVPTLRADTPAVQTNHEQR